MLPEDFSEEGNVTLRLLLPSRDIGAIIGRKGATINSIREESEAKIKISSSENEGGSFYREVVLSGTICQVYTACYLVAKRLEGESQEGAEDNEEVRLEVLFPNSITGAVIGRSGETIKQLRAKTNTQILISHDVLFGSTDRSICVTGTPADIKECVKYLAAILFENPAKGNNIPFRVTTPHPIHIRNRMIPLPPSQGPPRRPGPGGLSNNFVKGNPVSAAASDTMAVQKEYIGCVIGKNGIKIRQIRDLSQAQIRISSPGDDPNRTISITGTPDAVTTAKYLINYQITNELKKSP